MHAKRRAPPVFTNQPVVGLDATATDRYRSLLSPVQAAAVDAAALPIYETIKSRYGHASR